MDPSQLLQSLQKQAHVWLCFPNQIRSSRLLAKYDMLLSEEEHQRCRRFHFERDRQNYLVAHALVRTTLSRYAPVEPAAWTFVQNRHGRPEIKSSCSLPRLRFNLSHTHGLVTCVVTDSIGCGVDVEQNGRLKDPMSLAGQVFSPAEMATLRTQENLAQESRFYSYWTLKEAYIKARGIGMTLPLKQVTFDLDGRRPVGITFGADLGDRSKDWQFSLSQPSPRHTLAVALRRGEGPDLEVVERVTTPPT